MPNFKIKRLRIILFFLTILPTFSSAQFEFHSWSDHIDPYSIFNSKYLPEVISPDTVVKLGIESMQIIKYIQTETRKHLIEKYVNTEFDQLGRIISHYSIDSIWESQSWLFKNRWKVVLAQTWMCYSETNSVDSICVSILDNYPKRIKENFIDQYTFNIDSVIHETWIEVSNREFERQLVKYVTLPTEPIKYESLIQEVRRDTIGFASMKFVQTNFHQSDTIHGIVKHLYTEPTLIFNPNGTLQRKFPVPPHFQAYSNRCWFTDYYYNDKEQLIKKEWVGYENPKSEYYFFNENGLISSIWIEKNNEFLLNTVFLYQTKISSNKND